MKKTMHILSALTIVVALALFTTACSNEDLIVEQPKAPANEAPVYHVSIPASFSSDGQTRALTLGENTATSTFDDQNDYIYVHNVTRNAWALLPPKQNYPFVSWKYLQPSEISVDGKNCTLTGDLSFLTYNSGTGSWEECTTVADGDTYDLYYQARYYYDGSLYFSYTENSPSGLIDDIPYFDYAIAKNVTMSLSGNTLTLDGTASFVNYGSMFRQRLTFVPGANPGEGSANPAKIIKMTISTEHNTMIVKDMILNEDANKIGKTLRPQIDLIGNPSVIDANKDVYFALAFDNTALQNGDKLTFTAIDDNYNIYTGSKTIPAGGLQNGKYYYGDLTLTYSGTGYPKITRNDGGTIPEPNDGWYYIKPKDDDYNNLIDMTLTGSSDGFYVDLANTGTVTLTGNGVANYDGGYAFLKCDNGLTVNLASDYTIISYANSAIEGYWNNGYVYLKSTGGTHTLTLTAYYDGYKGIDCSNYSGSVVSAGDVIPELAADDNTTVTLTSETDNGDGTYTYVYTVAPTTPPAYYAATVGDIGKVIGADGNIYTDAAAATAASTTAEAMIAYVGTVDEVCKHGLAISLTDAYEYQTTWNSAETIVIPAWKAAHPIPGGRWCLPSPKTWQYMLWGYNVAFPEPTDISSFQTKLGAVGTALVDGGYYWTGDYLDDDNAFVVLFANSYASIISDTNAAGNPTLKTNNWHVRAVFAF